MNQCSFCNSQEGDNNELLAGNNGYICSECILKGYKMFYGNGEKVEINVDKDDFFREAKDVIDSMFKEIKHMKVLNDSKQAETSIGLHTLNEKLNGCDNGELIVLASRPGMGKTSLALNMALNTMEKGKGVAYISLEMSSETLMQRIISAKTSIPICALKVGNLRDAQWSQFFAATNKLSKNKLFINDDGYATIYNVRSKLRKLKSQHPEVSIAIIDYMQLISGDRKEDRQEEIYKIFQGLKNLSRELKISIVLLSQLNRGLESRDNKRPILSDFQEIGISENVDTILFVYRDDVCKEAQEKEIEIKAKEEGKEYQSEFRKKSEEEAEIIIAKSCTGEIGTVKCIFQNDFLRFVDIGH